MTVPNLFSHHTAMARHCTMVFASMMLSALLLPGLALADFPAQRSPIQWQQLQLNPNQQQAIESLDKEWQDKYQDMHPKIEMDRSKLRQMLNTPNADEAQVMEVQHRLQQNHDALHAEATRIFMRKKQQLTPQQRQQLNHMMQNHRRGNR